MDDSLVLADLAPDVRSQFTCRRSENLFAAIERCLDNGVGVCLVIDEDQRVLGKIDLEDIRAAILDGSAVGDATIEKHIVSCFGAAKLLRNDAGDDVLMPVLDRNGRLVNVAVDRTRRYVQVARPDLSHAEFRGVLDAFLSSWISSRGAYIQRFEQEFAARLGIKHGIAVSNGTVALHLALVALGVGPGDEVIVPDLTFAATINAVIFCGATPVIVDIDARTWTMTLESVAHAFTPRTKAIIPVHLYGRPAEMGPIAAFAKARNVYVIEDCAEAHGARYDGRALGCYSDIACFSFYANKIVTTGEGGMCLTDSPQLTAKLTQLRDHGASPDCSYWHERVGYNYRMTNLQAAIGLNQLWRIDRTLARNRELDRLYREHLSAMAGVTFPPPLPDEYEPVVWLVSAQVPPDSRTRLIDTARAHDIEMRPFFHSISEMPIYEKFAQPCPNSAALARSGINLPTSNGVDIGVIEKVTGVFRKVLCD